MLHYKDKALRVFKVFKSIVEKQDGKQIKVVRSDRTGEYYRCFENEQSLGHYVRFLQEHVMVA